MRQIQYVHERHFDSKGLKAKGGRTVVSEKITKTEFEAVVPSLNTPGFILKVGFAECSKKDNYCKKTGRDLAKSRMKVYHMFVTCKSEKELQLYNSELDITLFMKVSDFTDDVNFVNVV